MYFPALIMAIAKYISQFAFSSGYQLNFTYLFYSLSKGWSNVLFYGSNILRYYNKVMWLALSRGIDWTPEVVHYNYRCQYNLD